MVEVLATGGPGHARELAQYGVAEGVDVIAVFGGDGTTMQAAAALVGSDIALGVIREEPATCWLEICGSRLSRPRGASTSDSTTPAL